MTPARRARAATAAAWAALALALCGLLLFGVVGVARGDAVRFADVRYFYLAGQVAAAGTSPYDRAAMTAAALRNGLLGDRLDVFAYPPHSLPLWLLLSKLPIAVAHGLWGAANVGLLLALAWAMALRYLHRLGAARLRPAQQPPAAIAVAALVVGNPFAAHLVWSGQTGLMVLACLLLAWHCDTRGRWLAAGVLLGLATVKPHVSLLVLAWFVLTGRWRSAAVAAATIALLLAWPLHQFGSALLLQWTAAAAQYERQFLASLSYNTNLRSLIAGVGVALPAAFTPAMFALALSGVAALAWRHRRRPIPTPEVQAVLLAGALFLVGGRDYDMAALAPLVPVLFWHLRSDRRAAILAGGVLLLLCIPHRALATSGLPLLPYYRIVLLGLLWLWTLRLALGPATPTPPHIP